MKASMHWLNDYTDCTGVDFALGMTLSGSKVETVTKQADSLQNIVTAAITDVKPHPDADRLFVCRVDAGLPLTVVTGAGNVKTGDTVPVALEGAVLHNGTEIRTGKLRGVTSEGMLCSLAELGLTAEDFPGADEDGIFILPQEHKPGTPVSQALGLDDTTVEFEITNNRSDCFSIRGLAREASATFGRPLQLPVPSVKGGGGDINAHLRVTVENQELCPRFSARMVKNIQIGPSPRWMRDRLRACGLRPVNNIVDITNYVMLEYGQPMHAFDYAHVNGAHIIVRRALDGEVMNTLDGKDRKLTAGMPVIADADRVVGIAGVMGGANSEIGDTTTDIVFESANFNGTAVRRAASALGMWTESSSRFEKGLDQYGGGRYGTGLYAGRKPFRR
jgi:phenylalanyl-tRNA synthetase beta chain